MNHLGIYPDATLAENDAFINKQRRPTQVKILHIKM